MVIPKTSAISQPAKYRRDGSLRLTRRTLQRGIRHGWPWIVCVLSLVQVLQPVLLPCGAGAWGSIRVSRNAGGRRGRPRRT